MPEGKSYTYGAKGALICVLYVLTIALTAYLSLEFFEKYIPYFRVEWEYIIVPLLVIVAGMLAHYFGAYVISAGIYSGLFMYLVILEAHTLRISNPTQIYIYVFLIIPIVAISIKHLVVKRTEGRRRDLLLTLMLFLVILSTLFILNTFLLPNIMFHLRQLMQGLLELRLYVLAGDVGASISCLLYIIWGALPLIPPIAFFLLIITPIVRRAVISYFSASVYAITASEFAIFYLPLFFYNYLSRGGFLSSPHSLTLILLIAIHIAGLMMRFLFPLVTSSYITGLLRGLPRAGAGPALTLTLILAELIITNFPIFPPTLLLILVPILIFTTYALSFEFYSGAKAFLTVIVACTFLTFLITGVSVQNVYSLLLDICPVFILALLTAEILSPLSTSMLGIFKRSLTKAQTSEAEEEDERLHAYVFSLRERYEDLEETLNYEKLSISIDLKDIAIECVSLICMVLLILFGPLILSKIYEPFARSLEMESLKTFNVSVLLILAVPLIYIVWRRG